MKEKASRPVSARIPVICICVFFFLLLILFGNVRYETTDDLGFNLTAAGAFGPSVSTMFMNRAVIGALRQLYRLLPGCNWYLFLTLALNFTAVLSLCLFLARNMDAAAGSLTAVIVNFLLASDCYNRLQFTKNAALCTALAFLLLAGPFAGAAASEKIRPKDIPGWIPGTVFLLLGMAVRRQTALMMLPFGLLLLGAAAADSISRTRRISFSALRNAALLTLIPFFAVILLIAADRAAYRSEEWTDYLAFNSARSAYFDYGIIDYQEAPAEIDAAGFSSDDIALLNSWDYADRSVFTGEGLKALADIRDGRTGRGLRLNFYELCRTLRVIRHALQNNILAAAAVFLLLISVLTGDWRPGAFLLLLLLPLAGEYWYLTCIDRVIWRVEFGIWLSVLLSTACLLTRRQNIRIRDRRTAAVALTFALMLTAVTGGTCWNVFRLEKNSQFFTADAEDHRAFFEAVHTGDGPYILLDNAEAGRLFSFGRLTNVNGNMEGLFRNIGFLGGWLEDSPTGRYYLEERGITPSLHALIENKNVLLAAGENAAARVNLYLCEHYDPGTTARIVNTVEGVDLWEFTPGSAGGIHDPEPSS